MSDYASFDLNVISRADGYKLLASTVLPRPIAWITTLEEDGTLNAAPFSFFNVVSSDPPMIVVGFSTPSDRESKDTLANIRRTGEFVVNMVPEELAQAMNITATDAPRGVDEISLAGLHTEPSTQVKPSRIAGTPIALECRTFQILELDGRSRVLLANVLHMHVRHDCFADEEKLYLDPAKMKLVGRMHGAGGYCTTRELFDIPRVAWKDR